MEILDADDFGEWRTSNRRRRKKEEEEETACGSEGGESKQVALVHTGQRAAPITVSRPYTVISDVAILRGTVAFVRHCCCDHGF